MTKATKAEAAEKPVPQTDHRAIIEDLARQLYNTSPSGVHTIADKMLEHLEAVKDPKAYEAKMAAEHKAQAEHDAFQAKEMAERKAKVA